MKKSEADAILGNWLKDRYVTFNEHFGGDSDVIIAQQNEIRKRLERKKLDDLRYYSVDEICVRLFHFLPEICVEIKEVK